MPRIIKAGDTKTSLNPLADTFIFNRASEASNFCCHAVNNSLPYSTDCTEVCVVGSCKNLGATPMSGGFKMNSQRIQINDAVNHAVCTDIIKYRDMYTEQNDHKSYKDTSWKLVEVQNRIDYDTFEN